MKMLSKMFSSPMIFVDLHILFLFNSVLVFVGLFCGVSA